MSRPLRVFFAAVLSVLLTAAVWLLARGPAPAPGEVTRVDDDTIEFTAVVDTAAFAGDGSMDGYHFIVWRQGRASGDALLRARVTDVQVIRALEELGAEPGNALSIDSWDERHDEDSTAPDRVIEGPRIEIGVIVRGRDEPLGLDEILTDPGGRGFEMRFGGHEANIPEWHSGCVVCLYSCPGSKVGNAAYTVRDFVAGETRFGVRPGVLPQDGTPVRVRMTLAR